MGSVGGASLLALDKMGIRQQVEPKIKWVRGGGEVQTSVASGETEIALGPYLSDMRNPGLDIVGALPPGCDLATVYSCAIAAKAGGPVEAAEFIAMLSGEPGRNSRRQLGFV